MWKFCLFMLWKLLKMFLIKHQLIYFLFQNSMSNINLQYTLYAHILEDYLGSFLPTDNRAIPLYQTPSNVQHSPILTSSLSANYGRFVNFASNGELILLFSKMCAWFLVIKLSIKFEMEENSFYSFFVYKSAKTSFYFIQKESKIIL